MNGQQQRILIVDDDATLRGLLVRILSSHFDVDGAQSLEVARQALARQVYHGVLLDVRLGGAGSSDADGIALLKEIKLERPLLPVVVMTAFGDVHIAVEAMKLGAEDFVQKGNVDAAELSRRLREVIAEARRRLRVEAEAAEYRQLEPSNLVGASRPMNDLRNTISMAAQDGYCSVLLLGETGAGKEVVARAIHNAGWRREGPFTPVHMAGLSANLLDSELFGHEKGAFTGAIQAHAGYIEQSAGGVLFLDEIGDLSRELQVKLLRFLDDKVVVRVGSTKGRPLDAQVIAATHRPLKDLVAQGQFREDLYYRLKTLEITVPPLRERKEDIPLLADHFLSQLRKGGRTKLTGFSAPAIDSLSHFEWPGNVRQLRGVVEWAVLAAMQAGHWAVEKEDLPLEVQAEDGPVSDTAYGHETAPMAVERARAHAELECIERALIQTSGRKADALQLLGYPNRHTMRRRVQQLRERYPELWTAFPNVSQAYEKNGE